MKGVGWLGFLPAEAILPMMIAAGFCMIIGQTHLAFIIFGTGLALAFAPVIFAPIFAMLPTWATLLVLGLGLWTILPRKKKKK